MELNWILSNRHNVWDSHLITQLVCLLYPESKKLFDLQTNGFGQNGFGIKIDFSRPLTKEYLKELFDNFYSMYGSTTIRKLMYLLPEDMNTKSFYYKKRKVNKKEINYFIQRPFIYPDIQPKEILLSKETQLFAITFNYVDVSNAKYFKKIKIQDFYNGFNLNSLLVYVNIPGKYSVDLKALSIIKLNNLWFIFIDTLGLFEIPFTIKKNIIYFGNVKLKNYTFRFSKIKQAILFYLKTSDYITNKIDIFKECNCGVDYWWRQSNRDANYNGICWFDAGYMGIMVPLISRKLFLKPLAKKLKIPDESLFPCNDIWNTEDKFKIIKDLTNIDPYYRPSGGIQTVFQSLYPLLHKPYIVNFKNYWKMPYIPLYYPKMAMEYLTDSIDPTCDIFCIHTGELYYPKKIKHRFKNYSLTSIGIIFNIYNISFSEAIFSNRLHAISFIKCNTGWFLFDNNIASSGKPMKKLKTQIDGNDISFSDIKYKYHDVSLSEEAYPRIRLLKNTCSIALIYCLDN